MFLRLKSYHKMYQMLIFDNFSTIFWTIFQNPDLEVQNPDLFMTELPCQPLGARI